MFDSQKTFKPCIRISQDRRTIAAWELYEGFNSGHIAVYKTTRAGATTSLNAESGNRGERFTCIVPTNKIADETIVRDSIKYCQNPNLDVIHVKSNMHCIKNVELCEKYPDLKHLPYIPLADKCEDCEHFECCPITAPIRRPDADGFVLTYHKIVALQLSAMFRERTTAEKVLNSIAGSRNVILDEVHELQYGKEISYTVYDSKNGQRKNLDRYAGARHDFKYIDAVIKNMEVIFNDLTFNTKVHEVYGAGQDASHWKHHLSLTYANPAFKFQDRGAQGKQTAGIIKEIIELTKRRQDYNLSIEDIKALFPFMAIEKSNKLQVSAIKDKGIVQVKVSAIDFLFTDMVRNFTMSMQGNERRIFLTTATFCSEDFSSFFMGSVKPQGVMFGHQGDPTNNNEKMLILADNKKYNAIGDRSRYKMKGEIVSRIIEIMDSYEGEEVTVIALSEKEAGILEQALSEAGRAHKVDYYKSSETIGVSSSARIMIAVGIANKPVNAFDSLTKNSEQSRKMLYEAVQADTCQAWSRVKDPDGKEPSLVFGLGCCIDDVKACFKWGFNRNITGIAEHQNGCRTKVDINIKGIGITTPKLIHCKNFKEMLTHAGNHKQLCKKKRPNTENRLCNIIDGFSRFSAKILTVNSEFLNEIINRRDIIKVQTKDGRYLDKKIPISERDILQHLEGKQTIGGYQLDNQNSFVKWLCFDVDSHPKKEEEREACNEKAEKQKLELAEFLKKLKIPFILEESGSPHSYHFWVFLKPVHASAAHDFGHDIRRELGWKESDVEVNPKQKQIDKKGYGNFIKLPLGVSQKHGGKSRIYQDGKPVRKITNLEIKYIDITGYKAYESPKQKEAKKTRRSSEPVKFNMVSIGSYKVRECMLNASKLVLDGIGKAGEITRVYIARELIFAGMPPEEMCKYFEHQPDFNREKTLYKIEQVMKKDYPPVKCRTVYEELGNFIGCEQCPNFYRCGAMPEELKAEA